MKKILLICSLDGVANSIRGNKIKKYYEKKYEITLFNSFGINRLSTNKNSILFKLPKVGIYELLLYFTEILEIFLIKLPKNLKKRFYFYVLLLQMKLRSKIILNKVKIFQPSLIICDNQIDSYFILENNKKFRTFYYCATPLADELYFGNFLDKETYKKMLRKEIEIYKKSDYLAFHWNAYKTYVNKYLYTGSNLVQINGGCDKRNVVSQYSVPVRIIYLGYLRGYWINLELLSHLSKIYPYIDVYGYPEPNKNLKLNYKGYAASDVISKYQFGLITLSKDRLRREGFSAKHFDYLSYGVPVLMPDWRTSTRDIPSTRYYNESNFLEVIKENSEKKIWSKLHKSALQFSITHSWDKELKKISNMI